MNLELIKLRSHIVKLVRQFFDERGFLEMHTPRLVGFPDLEPHIEPFWTAVQEQNGQAHEAGLITSPEFAMKRLLAAGFDKIYDLGPCFRNGEPWDGTHDPEFLLLEWYRKNVSFKDLLDETEELVKYVLRALNDARFNQPFRRLTVSQAMKQYANVELEALVEDREALARVCRERGYTVNEDDTWDDLFFKIFLSEVEPKLSDEPTFLTHYPASMAALARRDPADPRFALRTELYIDGLELANGFAELADPVEQRARLEAQQVTRKKAGQRSWPIDGKFLADLPRMGEAVGIAFGIDRLVMLAAHAKSINDVLPFPARERFNPEPEKN